MRIRRGASLVAVLITAGVGITVAGPAQATGTPVLLTDYAGNGAGNFNPGAPTPGPATQAELSYPMTPRFDSLGNLYVADGVAETIDKITPDGIISTVAGDGTASNTIPTPGPALSKALDYPAAVVPDTSGGFYFADYDHSMVDHVDAAGNLTITAGTGTSGGSTPASPGPASSALLGHPSGLALDSSGNLYVADGSENVVYKIDTTGHLTVFAGGGGTAASATPVNATSASLSGPDGISFGPDGTLYIADTNNGDIDAVSGTGQLTRVGGTGSPSGGNAVVDGPALSTPFGYPMDVAVGSDGTLYVADADGSAAKISGGTITVIAGDGSGNAPTFNADPLAGGVGGPCGIAVDSRGNVYFGDWDHGYLEKVGFASGPSAPLNLAVAPGVSAGTATLSFDPPIYTDGVTVTGYEFSADGGATWTTITTSGSSPITASISGVAGGSRSIAVRAVSSYGSGDSASATATIVALPTPAVPTTVPSTVTPTATKKPKAASLPPLAVPTAKRANEIAVPADPASVHGKLKHTAADGRSRKGINAFAIATLKGYQLHKGQAASLGNDAVFAFDSATLTAKGRSEIKLLAASLKSAKAITCEGYTDFGGDPSHELTLSQRRARAVCAALKADGADVRTTTAGYGGTRPAVVGGTPAQRSANRRVVVTITA